MKLRHRKQLGKRFIANAKSKRYNPLRIDPTRTQTLRRAFMAKLRRQFAKLKLEIHDLLVKEDALGLRVVVNVFCPTGEGGGVDPSCSATDSSINTGLSSLPQTEDEAWDLANVLREEIIGDSRCAETGECLDAARIISSLHPSIEVWSGLYEGEDDNEHKIAKVGNYFIDVTSDQFDNGESVRVFTESQMKDGTWWEYERFTVSRNWTHGKRSPPVSGIIRSLRDKKSSLVSNVFCPTGSGGGINPTCSPSGGTVTVYHGTVESYTNDVKTNGLVLRQDTERSFNSTEDKGGKFYKDERGTSVFVTESVSLADVYAQRRSRMTKAKPVIVEIEVPESEFAKFKEDKEEYGSFYTQRIKPEWVKSVNRVEEENGMIKLVPVGNAASRKVYLVVEVDDDTTENAFCPTGEGGGVDPTCSPSSSTKSTSETERDGLSDFLKGSVVTDVVYHGSDKSVSDYQDRSGSPRASDPFSKHGTWFVEDEGVAKRYGSNTNASYVRITNPYYLDVDDIMEWNDEYGGIKYTMTAQDVQDIKDDGHDGIVFRVASQKLDEELGLDGEWDHKQYMVFDTKTQVKTARFTRPTTNQRWSSLTSTQKLTEFQRWLAQRYRNTISGANEESLWRAYIEDGYRRGAGRAFDDVNASKKAAKIKEEVDDYPRSKNDFLSTSFNQPESVDKIKLLASRTFDELEDVTREMSNKMSRILVDGLVTGSGPSEIARNLDDILDIGRNRAETIARTELIRAHAEGQLTAMETMGVEEVGVAVEWSTAGDERVCELCEALENVVLKIDEARGMIPRHVGCRCCWVPSGVGEDTDDQKRSAASIQDAIRTSAERGGAKEDDEEYDWGPGAMISKDRPEPIVNDALTAFSEAIRNVFCSTGEGGGIDPTCSPSESHASNQPTTDTVLWPKGGARKNTVYRVQPAGSDLHGHQSETSDESTIPGVFVFKNLNELAAIDWMNEKGVELVKIKHRDKDLFETRDQEGTGLRKGKGRIVGRRLFKDVRSVRKWAERMQSKDTTTNVFCPTGEGGGVDPTCSPSGSKQLDYPATKAEAIAQLESFGGRVVVGRSGKMPSKDEIYSVTTELAKLPPKAHDFVKQYGGTMDIVGGESVTDHPDFPLDANTPYGRDLNSGWHNVPGVAAGGQIKNTIIATGKLHANVHGSTSIVLHEQAHVLDMSGFLAGGVGYENRAYSERAAWKEVHSKTRWGDKYLSGRAGESFAESAAMYYHSRGTREMLPKRVRDYFEQTFGPPSLTENIFCPTGKGGGRDPTCKKGESGKIIPGPNTKIRTQHKLRQREPRKEDTPKNTTTRLVHGMSQSEQMTTRTVNGVKFSYSEDVKGSAERTISALKDADIPKGLWSANDEIVITSQSNKNDDEYSRQYYGREGLLQSGASGGDGTIVSYRGYSLPVGTLAHESGHNLAFKEWGSVNPPPSSTYGRAQSAEQPVTGYGSKSSAEDFAEACKAYTKTTGLVFRGANIATNREELRINFPQKYAALVKILDKHGGS